MTFQIFSTIHVSYDLLQMFSIFLTREHDHIVCVLCLLVTVHHGSSCARHACSVTVAQIQCHINFVWIFYCIYKHEPVFRTATAYKEKRYQPLIFCSCFYFVSIRVETKTALVSKACMQTQMQTANTNFTHFGSSAGNLTAPRFLFSSRRTGASITCKISLTSASCVMSFAVQPADTRLAFFWR